MRTRSRTVASKTIIGSTQTVSTVHTDCSGVGRADTVSLTFGTYSPQYETETITDEKGKGKVHRCTHSKRIVSTWEGTASFSNPNIAGGYLGVSVFNCPGYLGYVNSLNTLYCVDTLNGGMGTLGHGWSIGSLPFSEESLKNDVLEKASNLKADVLLNLIEANQLTPSVRSLAGDLPKLASHWKGIRRFIKTTTALRAASGAFLSWKFGIGPVISDIMAIDRYLRNVRERLRRHQAQESVRYSVKAVLPASFVGVSINPITIGAGGYFWTHVGKVLKDPEIRYVLVVKPNIGFSDDLFGSLELAINRFATTPADLAWEITPFSFVLDWFVDVRSCLRAINNMLGVKPYKIVGFTRSNSYHLSNTVTQTNKGACDGAVLWTNAIGTVEKKYYERSIVSDDGFMPHWRPHFGKNQAAISAALITQALTKIKR